MLHILYVSLSAFGGKYTDFRNVLGMSNIKFPVTFVNVRAHQSDESSVLSTFPSSVISGFCHDINKIGSMLRRIPKEP